MLLFIKQHLIQWWNSLSEGVMEAKTIDGFK